jgi:hypothetical protein
MAAFPVTQLRITPNALGTKYDIMVGVTISS